MDDRHNKVLWDAVRSESDPIRAIALAADVGETVVAASLADRNAIREQLTAFRKVLSGNGDPSHSLLNRVENIENDMAEAKDELEKISNLLKGDLKLEGGESLLDEIRKQKRTLDSLSKLGWALLSALVVRLGLELISLLM